METGSTRVYTTTDSDGNTVEVHEETFIVEGEDTAARLSSLAGSAHTSQVTETLPDGSVVITTTITTVGEDGVETEEIITETIPPPADAASQTAYAKVDESHAFHNQEPSGRESVAQTSSSGISSAGGATTKTIVAQYAEDEYSEYKPPKRYEKHQKESAAEKLAPKVSIMGLPKDHQQKTAASNQIRAKPVMRPASDREDLSTTTELDGSSSHQNGHHQSEGADEHHEPHFERGAVENQPVVRTDVVRESDRNEEEQLPEKGTARSLLSKFKNIEDDAQKQKQYRPSGVAVKPTPTPLRPAAREGIATLPGGSTSHSEPEQKYESENQPVVRTDVVKESDTNLAEGLPETGLARNLLSKFKSLETSSQARVEYKPSSVAAKTWSKTGSRLSSTSPVHHVHAEPKFEGGEVENVPQVRTDVVKESDGATVEELPERGLAQNLLSKFKAIESEAQEVRQRRTPSSVHTPRGGRESRTSVTSSEGFGVHVEPAVEGGEFENQPQVRSDVVRESDVNLGEELPEAGLARNLLSRFKSIESDARESQRSQYRPSGVASKATPSKIQLMAGRSAYGAAVSLPKTDADAAAAGDAAAADVGPRVESGEFESVPQVRSDVVRESDSQVEELPNRGTASALLSRFKNIEAEASTRRDYVPSGIANKPTPTPMGVARLHLSISADGTTPLSPSPGAAVVSAYEPKIEGGEFENQPAPRPADVACEGQRLEADALPEQGLAKGLLSKFKTLEEGAAYQKDYQPSGVGRKSLSGYGGASKKATDDDEQHQPL